MITNIKEKQFQFVRYCNECETNSGGFFFFQNKFYFQKHGRKKNRSQSKNKCKFIL